MSGDAELVGEGRFKVDRRRALEKMRKHQLEQPALFLLNWVRLANACGAARLRVHRWFAPGLALEFDGKNFQRSSLEAPFEPLFTDGAENDRRRLLARALIGSFSLPNASLSLEAGSLFGLEMRSLEDFEVKQLGALRRGTFVKIAWKGGPHPADCVRILSKRCRLSRARISIEDWNVNADALPEYRREIGGDRMWLEVPADPESTACSLALSALGVEVGVLAPRAAAPVAGFVDADGLTLDASLARPVRDEVLEHLEKKLGAEARRFLIQRIQDQGGDFASLCARIARPEKRKAWRYRMTDPGRVKKMLLWFAFGEHGDPETRDPLGKLARRTRWLRAQVERRFRSEDAPIDTPLKKALNRAPLWINALGQPMSYNHLRSALEFEGTLALLARWRRRRPDERWLRTSFPSKYYDFKHVIWIENSDETARLARIFGREKLREI